jgi:hypothetical protein
MNERIKELIYKTSAFGPGGETMDRYNCSSSDLEKFAELIVKECAMVAWQHTPDTEELEYSHLIEDKILKHFGVEL